MERNDMGTFSPADDLESNGYFCLNEMLDPATSAALCARLDHFANIHPGRKALIPDEFFNDFITTPVLLRFAESLLGDRILFHHANGRAMKTAGLPKEWHHDYDGLKPWAPTDPLMI